MINVENSALEGNRLDYEEITATFREETSITTRNASTAARPSFQQPECDVWS